MGDLSRMVFLALLFVLLFPVPEASAKEDCKNATVVLLDASRSMDGPMERSGGGHDNMTQMDAAQMALKQSIEKMDDETCLGIYVMSGNNEGWLHKLGPYDKDLLFAKIDQVVPNRNTPLAKTMIKTMNALLEFRRQQGPTGQYKLFILTDGEESDKKMIPKVGEFSKLIKSRGIALDVVAVNMPDNLALQQYADTFVNANTAETLVREVTNVMTEIDDSDPQASQEVYDTISAFSPGVAMTISKSSSDQSDVDYNNATVTLDQSGNIVKPRPSAPSPVPTGGGNDSHPSQATCSTVNVMCGGFDVLVVLMIAGFIVWARRR